MKLNPTAFGLALGAATAILWTMNITGYLIGLFIWGASACITGWITGVRYNKFAASGV